MKGGKYMEINNAVITTEDEEYHLDLQITGKNLKIPLTKDEPNEIKKVFNELITHLKRGQFNFVLEEKEDGDLVYHIAKEYIEQLNKELNDIYQELESYQLLDQILEKKTTSTSKE